MTKRKVFSVENNKEKRALSDDQLDNVTGGIEDQITSTERVEDGTCPTCGGTAYRVTQKGFLGPFEIEKTWRECPVHGWISV